MCHSNDDIYAPIHARVSTSLHRPSQPYSPAMFKTKKCTSNKTERANSTHAPCARPTHRPRQTANPSPLTGHFFNSTSRLMASLLLSPAVHVPLSRSSPLRSASRRPTLRGATGNIGPIIRNSLVCVAQARPSPEQSQQLASLSEAARYFQHWEEKSLSRHAVPRLVPLDGRRWGRGRKSSHGIFHYGDMLNLAMHKRCLPNSRCRHPAFLIILVLGSTVLVLYAQHS